MRDLRKDCGSTSNFGRPLDTNCANKKPRLTEFLAFLEAKSANHITTKLAVAWATESSNGHKHSCFERLSFVRSFATHMSSMDARTEVPPAGAVRRPEIALRPYIYTRDEIARLMAAARNLFSPQKLRCHTYYHLVGLLATTGMRSGEAVRLANSDVNLAEGLITIRESKFGKSRVVPLHPTTVNSLAGYTARRDAFLKKAEAPTFFINERRGPIGSPHKSFRDIRCAAGLEKTRDHIRPRMHDLRHTFAVQTLLAWYRNGADVERNLPILSTFLGHSQVENTYWYLSSTPELLGAECERLETRWRRSQ